MGASPSIDDAIELLRDPANVTSRLAALQAIGMVGVNSAVVLGELQARGARSREEAHALVRQGLARIGGRDASYWHERTGLRPGRVMADRRLVPVFHVPANQLAASPSTSRY